MSHGRRALLLAAVAWPFAAMGQPKKVYRIGYLSNGPGIEAREEALRQRLRELGYSDGQNAIIEWRFNKGDLKRNPELAADLVRLKVDCIVAVGVTPIRAARNASREIPIVMATIDADPIAMGFIENLARPGGNITGFTAIAYELAGKRLEFLKELLPKSTRAAILVDPAGRDAAREQIRGTAAAARKLGMQVEVLEPRGPEELTSVLSAARAARVEGLSVVAIGWINSHRAQIVRLAAELKLPAIYSTSHFSGGLMSYSADMLQQYREVAGYVAKVLGGTKPADLPVQQPTKFELIVNLKTAQALGVTIPQTIMLRADRVIQ